MITDSCDECPAPMACRDRGVCSKSEQTVERMNRSLMGFSRVHQVVQPTMTHLEITAEPKFWIQLSKEDLEVLTVLSKSHYDAVCQNVGLVGGFVYGWRNVLQFSSNPQPRLSAKWRQLDTLMKVMEQAELCANSKVITVEQFGLVLKMRRFFTACMNKWDSIRSKWIWEGEV